MTPKARSSHAEAQSTKSDLPDGWQSLNLGQLCKFVRGVNFDKSDVRYSAAPEYLPILRAGNIQDELDLVNDLVWVPKANISPEQLLQQGDVVVCMSSGSPDVVGKTAQLKGKFAGSVGSFCGIIRARSPELVDYISFWLRSAAFREWRDNQARGANIQNLRFSQFETIQLPLPPAPERMRITTILKEQMVAAERARASAEAQLQAAENLPAAYLRDVFNNGESKSWPRKRLGDIAKTASGSTPSRGRLDYYGGTIPWVKTSELCDGFIHGTEEHITEKALQECSLSLLPEETLLIAMYGQGKTRGRTGLLKVPATTNQACFAILPNPTVFETAYLQWWFRNNYSRLRQETASRGGNQPNLNGIFLREQELQLPALSDQRRIAAKLSSQMASAECLRQALAEQLDTINKLPAALLRRAFAGEL